MRSLEPGRDATMIYVIDQQMHHEVASVHLVIEILEQE
jgi:hypothetical protein